MPEHTGLSSEDTAKGLRPDQDRHIVHAMGVVSSIQHPAGASGVCLLPIWELHTKRQRTQLVVSLHIQARVSMPHLMYLSPP